MIARRVAAVDIGTNTVRLLVAESRAPGLPGHGPLVDLDRRVHVVRLGQGVDATGRLAGEAVARTLGVLRTYGDALRSWRPERVKVVATSAVRDATDRDPFLDAVELAVGTRPEVIDGEREAGLAFAGVRSGLDPEGSTVVIDLGGGSTEFVYGSETVEFSTSVDIGSVRLTERMLARGPHDPAAMAEARGHVDGMFASVELPAVPDRAVGVAGTFTTLAALHIGLEVYRNGSVHGSRLGVANIAALADRLGSSTIEEIVAMGPVDPGRAGVLTAGAIVAERALMATGLDESIVSEADLLDGVALWAADLLG